MSDTHGLVRPEVARVLDGVDLILHAGDVGGTAVLRKLSAIAPVEAVFGNVDDPHDPSLARERVVTLGGISIHVSHGHELRSPSPERVLATYAGDVVVFGHTHRAVAARDQRGRLAVNPGAAGPRRFDLQPSVAILTIAGAAADVRIVSLA
ncbi:MAG: metallophosphoesterase family protein [Betaproteobacteria bacterium]